MHTAPLGLLLFAVGCAAAPDLESPVPKLFAEHRWFELRTAGGLQTTDPLANAAVALAFDDVATCEKLVGEYLTRAPASSDLARAHDILCTLHFRHGRFRTAFADSEKRAQARQGGGAALEHDEFLRTLAHEPDMAIVRHEPCSLRMRYMNAFIPITINGRRYHGFLDSGANLSLISKSAAKDLGLAIVPVQVTLFDSTGNGGAVKEVAFADRLKLGDIELQHVPLLVVGDDAQPFVEWDDGNRCVLGIQVFLACRTLRWRKAFVGAALDLGFPSGPREQSGGNLCFEAATPRVAAGFQGQPITLALDTGASSSTLSSRFAHEFSAYVQSNGTKSRREWSGVVAAAATESILLPQIALEMSGGVITIHPMHVIASREDEPCHGVLGAEFMQFARSVTLDFGAMRMDIR